MYRHRPPLLGSNVSSCISYPRGPSHWTYSAGSTKALNTSSRGASNSLVMKSSCLPDSAVMVVLCFFADMVFLPFLNFLYNVVKAIKPLAPKTLERCDPIENG